MLLPLAVVVALRLSPLALMVELLPRLALVLALTTLMATPTPTWVLLPLLALPEEALPLALALAVVALVALRESRPPALTLALGCSEALTLLVAMFSPRAAATPTWPSLVLALGMLAPLALEEPLLLALAKESCLLNCWLALLWLALLLALLLAPCAPAMPVALLLDAPLALKEMKPPAWRLR